MVFFASARKFAICRGGDEACTDVPGTCDRFESMAYCKGKFYAVTSTWDLVICDARASPPEIAGRFPLGPPSPRFYLLEFQPADDLLLVTKAASSEMWDMVNSLTCSCWTGESRDRRGHELIALVIGFCSCRTTTFALLASECTGCRPNCIYYGDPFYKLQELSMNEADHNIGVYSVEEESVQMIPCLLRNIGDWELALWVRPVP